MSFEMACMALKETSQDWTAAGTFSPIAEPLPPCQPTQDNWIDFNRIDSNPDAIL